MGHQGPRGAGLDCGGGQGGQPRGSGLDCGGGLDDPTRSAGRWGNDARDRKRAVERANRPEKLPPSKGPRATAARWDNHARGSKRVVVRAKRQAEQLAKFLAKSIRLGDALAKDISLQMSPADLKTLAKHVQDRNIVDGSVVRAVERRRSLSADDLKYLRLASSLVDDTALKISAKALAGLHAHATTHGFYTAAQRQAVLQRVSTAATDRAKQLVKRTERAADHAADNAAQLQRIATLSDLGKALAKDISLQMSPADLKTLAKHVQDRNIVDGSVVRAVERRRSLSADDLKHLRLASSLVADTALKISAKALGCLHAHVTTPDTLYTTAQREAVLQRVSTAATDRAKQLVKRTERELASSKHRQASARRNYQAELKLLRKSHGSYLYHIVTTQQPCEHCETVRIGREKSALCCASGGFVLCRFGAPGAQTRHQDNPPELEALLCQPKVALHGRAINCMFSLTAIGVKRADDPNCRFVNPAGSTTSQNFGVCRLNGII